MLWCYFIKRLDFLMLGSVYGLSWSLSWSGIYPIYIGYWSVFRCDWFWWIMTRCLDILPLTSICNNYVSFGLLEARVPGCINRLYQLGMNELLILTLEVNYFRLYVIWGCFLISVIISVYVDLVWPWGIQKTSLYDWLLRIFSIDYR